MKKKQQKPQLESNFIMDGLHLFLGHRSCRRATRNSANVF